MRRWFGALAALAIIGCGPRSAHTTRPHAHAQSTTVGRAGGLTVATLRRPMGERALAALFIDAGSRDADPPQVAFLAAELAAHRASARARVTPDASELWTSCDRTRLERCAERLARGLATRTVARDALAQASRELVRRRRLAATRDERVADAATVRSLLGPGATPLGEAERDDEADGALVERFLESHYGPTRALFVVVGDVTSADVETSTRAFEGARPALELRGRGDVGEGGVVALRGRRRVLSLGVRMPTLTAATQVGGALVDPLLGDPELVVRVFPVRGGAVTVARRALEEGEGATAPARLAAALVAASAETNPQQDLSFEVDDPLRAAQAFGTRWASRGSPIEDAPVFALTVVAPSPVSEHALAGALERARRDRDTERGGDERTLALCSARITTERWPGAPRVAVAVAFEGGAREEPPALLGRAALLSRLMATRCGLDAGTLRERLRSLGGRATPHLTPERFGLVVELPRARWREAVDLAAACAARPPSERTDVDGARLELLGRLGPGERTSTRAAPILSPAAPGRVAPWGEGVSLSRLTLGELAAAHAALAVRSRLRASVVGDVPLERAIARLADRLRTLPVGEPAPAPAPWSTPADDPGASPDTRDDQPRVSVALATTVGDRRESPRVRAWAAALARRLSGGGLDALASMGASDSGGSWLAVELRAETGALEGLEARVMRALSETRAPAHTPPAETPADRAWELTGPVPEGDPPDVIAALREARAVIQLRGVGRSASLRRLER